MGRKAKAKTVSTPSVPQIMTVPLSRIKPAPWNYKEEGAPILKRKLLESIKEDRSAGVMAVRELGGGYFEVIDGNHRLEALQELGWTEATVENFGVITKARAVLISTRRNHQWFEDDVQRLSRLFQDDVFQEFSKEDIERFSYHTQKDLDALEALAKWDWENVPELKKWKPPEEGECIVIRIEDPNIRAQWKQFMSLIGKDREPEVALGLAVARYMASEKEASR